MGLKEYIGCKMVKSGLIGGNRLAVKPKIFLSPFLKSIVKNTISSCWRLLLRDVPLLRKRKRGLRYDC